MNYDRDTGNVPIRAFFTKDNDGITFNQAVDFSATSGVFQLIPPLGETWFIDSLGVAIQCTGNLAMYGYGDSLYALPNGYDIVLKDSFGNIKSYLTKSYDSVLHLIPVQKIADLFAFTQAQLQGPEIIGDHAKGVVFTLHFTPAIVIGNGFYLESTFTDDLSYLVFQNIHITGNRSLAYI
jgi:hypothetical protein